MQPNYHFPFFGAGKTTFANAMQLVVIFKNKPADSQQKQILGIAPPLIKQLFWDNQFLKVYNNTDQFADSFSPNKSEAADKFIASDSQITTFNITIEKWLNEIHEISPIFLVYRHQHPDAVFSDWHQWSIKQFKTILPFFNDVIDAYKYDSIKSHVIFNLLSKIEPSKLESKHIKFLHPGEAEFKALQTKNLQPLKNSPSLGYAQKTFITFEKHLNQKSQKQIIDYAQILLNVKEELPKDVFKGLTQVFFSKLEDAKSAVFIKIANNITDEKFVIKTAYQAYQFIREQKYRESQDVFIKLLCLPEEVYTKSFFYTNMLWIFQKDNTGLPVDIKRNEFVLQKYLPKATKDDPRIFYSVCRIYTEMKAYDKAYEMVEQALVYLVEKEWMLSEIKSDPIFQTFCEKTNVLELLESYAHETNINLKPLCISKRVAYQMFSVHMIYNSGLEVDFTDILLINGNVNIDGELNTIYKDDLEGIKKANKKVLIIINGHANATTVNELAHTNVLVMGSLNSPNKMACKNHTERKSTSFNYTLKKRKWGLYRELVLNLETWGTGILENEISRETYHAFCKAYLVDNEKPDDILKKMTKNFSESYSDKGIPNTCDYWFAITYALWETCAINNSVIKKIETFINEGIDLEKWYKLDVDNKTFNQRKQVVNQFFIQIQVSKNTPQILEYPIERPAVFKKGECIAFKHKNGNYGGFVVLEEINDENVCEVPCDVIIITKINQKNKPSRLDFKNAEILYFTNGIYEGNHAVFDYGTTKFYVDKDTFEFIDNIQIDKEKSKPFRSIDLLWPWSYIKIHIETQLLFDKSNSISSQSIYIKDLI